MDLMKIQNLGHQSKLGYVGGILILPYILIMNKVVLIINKHTGPDYLMVLVLMYMSGLVVVFLLKSGWILFSEVVLLTVL